MNRMEAAPEVVRVESLGALTRVRHGFFTRHGGASTNRDEAKPPPQKARNSALPARQDEDGA